MRRANSLCNGRTYCATLKRRLGSRAKSHAIVVKGMPMTKGMTNSEGQKVIAVKAMPIMKAKAKTQTPVKAMPLKGKAVKVKAMPQKGKKIAEEKKVSQDAPEPVAKIADELTIDPVWGIPAYFDFELNCW